MYIYVKFYGWLIKFEKLLHYDLIEMHHGYEVLLSWFYPNPSRKLDVFVNFDLLLAVGIQFLDVNELSVIALAFNKSINWWLIGKIYRLVN